MALYLLSLAFIHMETPLSFACSAFMAIEYFVHLYYRSVLFYFLEDNTACLYLYII